MGRRRNRLVLSVLVVMALGGAACGSDSGSGGGDATQSGGSQAGGEPAAAADRPLRILVSNDDGVEGPGLDVLVEALRQVPNVELVVVAPAADQSGSSDRTTPGGVPYASATTVSGFPAVAVEGFPADSVLVALDELGELPDLVVSGINTGQNAGPVAALSGTVGVARTAVRRGIPAVAVSGAISFDPAAFAIGAELVVAWIEEHRQALLDGTQPAEVVFSINIPTCPAEQIGPLRSVPLAVALPEGGNPWVSNCDLADPAPTDDVLGLIAGYAVITEVPTELEPAAG
jgi:5'-nucleotidase